MTRRLRATLVRLRQLAPGERRQTILALAMLLTAWCLTRVLPTRRLLRIGEIEDTVSPNQPSPQLYARALHRASRFAGIHNCLVKGVALRMLLSHAKLHSTLHIGLRKNEQYRLAAHAWVSVGDTVVLGADEFSRDYRQIYPDFSADTVKRPAEREDRQPEKAAVPDRNSSAS